MKDFLRWTVVAILASPLLASPAHAFNTMSSDDSGAVGSAYHAADPDKALTEGGNSTRGWVHKEGNTTFRMQMQQNNGPSGFANDRAFLTGRGLPNNAAAQSFEDSIPKP